jgi:alginate O-acetyltransferase complex protein AlgI
VIFNSFEFLFAFLPIVCFLYFALTRWISHPAGRLWLTFASFAFYAYWDVRYVALLLGSIAFNFFAGRMIRPGQRGWLIAGIAGNLSLLVYYKYAGFFLGIQGIILPLGISFFTFTQIAFLMDVYREGVREYDFVDYALFVSYFPHLLAGPILHHGEMMPQFTDSMRSRFDPARFAPGLALLAAGLAKKVLIADPIASIASPAFANVANLQFGSAWIAALAYTVQIYFDFSGYTDMARGMSKILNIELPINFNSPYQARNLQEFWARWHITLSRFLRDYLFFAVGGAKRRSTTGPYIATLITFTLAGLWHGANWTFILWGLFNGIGLVIVRLWRWTMPVLVARALTFLTVTMLWVWFRASSVSDAWVMTRAMLAANGVNWHVTPDASLLTLLAAALLLAWLVPNTQKLFERPTLAPAWCVALGLLLAISIASLQHASEFLYFNF